MADNSRTEMLLRYRSAKPVQPRKIIAPLIGQSKASIYSQLGKSLKSVKCKLPAVDYEVKKHVWAELDGRLYIKCGSDVFVSIIVLFLLESSGCKRR